MELVLLWKVTIGVARSITISLVVVIIILNYPNQKPRNVAISIGEHVGIHMNVICAIILCQLILVIKEERMEYIFSYLAVSTVTLLWGGAALASIAIWKE